MSRAGHSSRGSGGMGLAPRFALAIGFALTVVVGASTFLLYDSTRGLIDRSVSGARDEAARLTAHLHPESPEPIEFTQIGTGVTSIGDSSYRGRVSFDTGPLAGQEGVVWVNKADGQMRPVMVAPTADADPARTLAGLFLGMAALVVLVGVAVAFVVAGQVAGPIEVIADDVRTIVRGSVRHRGRPRAGREVAALASAVDRVAAQLKEAQSAEIELGVREREREVALEVQEALRPQRTPTLEGYELAAAHVPGAEPGGDFHDFVQCADGRLGVLVADVSGVGVPAALVGGTARAYLRSALSLGGDLADILRRVNREVAGDVRRGMAVTALVATLDPNTGELLVASAGHKLPLLAASGGKLGKVHPEGIALGFDRGPVFDKSLVIARLRLEPGDRVVLAGVGAVLVEDPDGEELGEGRFFKQVARNVPDRAPVALEGLLTGLEAHADGTPYPRDVSLVILARDA